MKIYYDSDIQLDRIRSKKVAVVGYGSQGHAHAMNLRESGVEVVVCLKDTSPSRAKAQKSDFPVWDTPKGVAWADVTMILVPDEHQGDLYRTEIEPHLKPGKALAFAHGFNVHFGQIVPPAGVDCFMVAPKGPGHLVRSEYAAGSGVPSLVAIRQDATGHALDTALAYAGALGAGRAGVVETNFREETETDLFGEQVVLCGGLTALIQAGFETLVEAGYSPEMAYFECLHEVKLIVDLIYEGGIENMRYSISNTARYGDLTRGPRIVTEETKKEMRRILSEIQTGSFAREWLLENRVGRPVFKALSRRGEEHPIEEVGREIRGMMPWLARKRLVDREKN